MNWIHTLHMPQLPSLTAVRVFDAAARHENFTRAAEELGLTQSAVSHQIRALEHRLMMPLFSRSKGRVALTEAGRRLAPQIAAAFESLDEAFATLTHDDGKLLAISSASTFGTVWLAPRLGGFQIQHQDLGVRLTADRHLVDFSTGEFDLAIRIGAGDWPGLREQFLFRVHYTPVCSPDFLLRHALRDPEQLLDLPRFSPRAEWWQDWFQGVGVNLPAESESSVLELDNQTLEANAALAGSGIAMLTPFLWRTELAAGRLVQPFAHVQHSTKSYWLVYPEAKRMQLKVRTFREWLLQQIGKAAETEPPDAFMNPVDNAGEGQRTDLAR